MRYIKGVADMSGIHVFMVICEVVAVLGLSYGFLHEDRLVAFEHKLYVIVRYNIRRIKRERAYDKIRKERSFVLAVDNSGSVEYKERADGQITMVG